MHGETLGCVVEEQLPGALPHSEGRHFTGVWCNWFGFPVAGGVEGSVSSGDLFFFPPIPSPLGVFLPVQPWMFSTGLLYNPPRQKTKLKFYYLFTSVSLLGWMWSKYLCRFIETPLKGIRLQTKLLFFTVAKTWE